MQPPALALEELAALSEPLELASEGPLPDPLELVVVVVLVRSITLPAPPSPFAGTPPAPPLPSAGALPPPPPMPNGLSRSAPISSAQPQPEPITRASAAPRNVIAW